MDDKGLKELVLNLDLSDSVELYHKVTGVSHQLAASIGRDFQKYLYLRVKYPNKILPPSFELNTFWSILIEGGVYSELCLKMKKSNGLSLPEYRQYFYEKKYINTRDWYYFKNVTQTLFLEEFDSYLTVTNINIAIRAFRFLKFHYGSMISIILPILLTTIIGSYVSYNNEIYELHNTLDTKTRLLTYNDELIYTTCKGPKDFLSSNFYYQILFDTNNKLKDSYEKFTILAKRSYEEGKITKNLLKHLEPIGEYNEKIFRAGLSICKTLKLKNIDEIGIMRENAIQAIKDSRKDKIVSFWNHFSY